MKLKLATGLLGIILAGYSGYQALIISKMGVMNQIPQLEGDGGAGILFSILCLIAALLCFIKPILSLPIFVLSALISILAGIIYYDSVMYIWSAVPLVLAFTSYLSFRTTKSACSKRVQINKT